MTRSRIFNDLEFVVRWEQRNREFLPHPLMYISKSRLRGEHERLKRELRDQVRTVPDYDADEIIETMTEADIRIVVRGWSEQDSDDPAKVVRLLGVRRGAKGFTIRQLPAETPWHTDGFAVTECDAIELAAELVAQLPEVDAGRLGEVALPPSAAVRDGMDYSRQRSSVLDSSFSFDVGDVEQANRFRSLPATDAGSISITQGGSRFGPRGITRHQLEWRDLTDDGRYVITPQAAVAADGLQMTKLINIRVAEVVRAIREERQ
jgi:hypothetical protein